MAIKKTTRNTFGQVSKSPPLARIGYKPSTEEVRKAERIVSSIVTKHLTRANPEYEDVVAGIMMEWIRGLLYFYDPQKSNPITYADNLARYYLKRFFARQQKTVKAMRAFQESKCQETLYHDTQEIDERDERSTQLDRAMRQMHPQHAEAAVLLYARNLNSIACANALQISANTLRSWKHRGLMQVSEHTAQGDNCCPPSAA
ncbi:MAG: hypothetical protein L6Q57_08300 [Alphaproteobacteria bacterium]|nr:hypothetical protein [Alphaproteobacteria bacterium]